MIQFTPDGICAAVVGTGGGGEEQSSLLGPEAARRSVAPCRSGCDQSRLLRGLGGNLRCGNEHAGIGLAGPAGAPPHNAALELYRHRELGDFADRVRHRFALSARFLGSGCFSPTAYSRSRIAPPFRSMMIVPLCTQQRYVIKDTRAY